MSRPSAIFSDRLTNSYISLDSVRQRFERLATTHVIPRRDIEHVYEGLFLKAYAAFESFIEDLFLGLLVESADIYSNKQSIIPRVKIRSYIIARELIKGSERKKYVNWIPYDNTLDLAKQFFRGGRPFTELNTAQKQHILKCAIIRNAITHNSKYSATRFGSYVLGSTPARERTPAGYLRGLYRISPPQTRYENCASELLRIAKFLAR